MNKKELELILSQLKDFVDPKVDLEQYQTDATIAADALWNAHLNNHLRGKTVADLGCGPGTFGLGALILGAKQVYFVDLDKEAIKLAKENKKKIEKILNKKLKCGFVNKNVKEFDKKVDVVLQNPPFGVKRTHHDKLFLVKATEISPIIYSFHKLTTEGFVKKFAKDNGFKIKHTYKYHFPIKRRFLFHMKRVKYVDVGCWNLVKK